MANEANRDATDASHPPSRPRARAKSVICLFQHGGPSQMDLFDPKPALTKHHGKPYPGQLEIHFNNAGGEPPGFAVPVPAARPVGDRCSASCCPHIAGIADDLTLVRSMTTESVDHETALAADPHRQDPGRAGPTWGSWVVYGLGTENQNLPAYVVLSDPGGLPVDGIRNWSSGWLPAVYQGTPFRSGHAPVLNLKTPTGHHARGPHRPARLPRRAEPRPSRPHPGNAELEARIANFEIAARDADRRSRGPRPVAASRNRPGGCMAWTTRSRASTAPAACSPAAWSSGASGSSSSS